MTQAAHANRHASTGLLNRRYAAGMGEDRAQSVIDATWNILDGQMETGCRGAPGCRPLRSQASWLRGADRPYAESRPSACAVLFVDRSA
jgi:hypothetical protein